MLIDSFDIQKEEKTKYLAENISSVCVKGDVIALSGELGSGKTTFAKYFIKNLVKTNSVPSPSYNLLITYNSKSKIICHMDAWRIKNDFEAISLGISEMYEHSIFIIEWAEKIKKLIPKGSLKLTIKKVNNKRDLFIEGNADWKTRLKNLKIND